jgi:hypothetical protein
VNDRMFVIETRKDLKNFEEAIHYVETIDLGDVGIERIPKWFEDEEEITDEDLELEFWNVSYRFIQFCNFFRKSKLQQLRMKA